MSTPNMSTSGSSTAQPGAIQDAGTDGGTGQSARQQMRDVKDQVVGQAKNTLQQAKNRAGSSLDESRTQVADQIGGVAQAFRRTGEQLRGENQNRIAGLTDTVAQRVEQIAGYLRDRNPQEMRGDLERIARRQPAAVIGSAFAIGLLAARFFKSSESGTSETGEDYSRSGSYGSRDYSGAGTGGTGYTRAGYGGTANEGTGYTGSGYGGTNPSGGSMGGGYAGA